MDDFKTIKSIRSFKFFMPSILWMVLIFYFSHEPGDISSKNNNFIVDLLYKINSKIVDFLGYENLNILVRKTAHVTEYLILFMLLYYGFHKIYKNKNIKNLYKASVCSAFVTILYAFTDEFHQIFIQGREGKIFDVFIDSIGVLIGIIIVRIVLKRKAS